MAHLATSSSSSTAHCSICLEGRTVANLQCSHLFHLDCIGSTFNALGIMQCPNCLVVENGVWKFFEVDNSEPERIMNYGDYDEDLHPCEMQCGCLCSLLHGRLVEVLNSKRRELSVPRYEDLFEQLPMFDDDPNANNSLHPPNEKSVPPFIHHRHQRNNQFILNSISACINGAGRRMSVSQFPTLNLREDPLSPRNLGSLAQPVVLDPRFGSSMGSGTPNNNSSGIYYFGSMLPSRRNSPSPVVRHMLAGRRSNNGIPSCRFPGAENATPPSEETRRLNGFS